MGFLLTESTFDYIAIHDVDLIPENKNITYSYPNLGPYHVSAPGLHPKYNYEKFLGGILLITKDHFRAVSISYIKARSYLYFFLHFTNLDMYVYQQNMQCVSEKNAQTLKWYSLGLYRSSAPAPAEIRPFLQIRLISGSGQNWAGFWLEPDIEKIH